ncbi:hypothetical protein GQ600_8011 [Phytophthora cactorum]|nr:hypothetical protein GQ600_8011 [Phytophthora cactorum]
MLNWIQVIALSTVSESIVSSAQSFSFRDATISTSTGTVASSDSDDDVCSDPQSFPPVQHGKVSGDDSQPNRNIVFDLPITICTCLGMHVSEAIKTTDRITTRLSSS